MTAAQDYRRVAAVYDALARLYSGGAIPACRSWGASQAKPGQRVLFAGCGTGADALAAARAGARVTGVDASVHMLERARRRDGHGAVEWVQADLLAHDPPLPYDTVVAAFFLNVFDAAQLAPVAAHLRRLLRPEGRLVVADFAPAGRRGRVLQRLFHHLPMWTFAHLTGSARHPIHDLAGALSRTGFRVRRRQSFRLFGAGPAWIEGLEVVPR